MSCSVSFALGAPTRFGGTVAPTRPARQFAPGPLLGALCVAAAMSTGCATVPAPSSTVRMCRGADCETVPRSTADASLTAPVAADPAMRQLEQLARRDPRAAYDLALRLLRGDGVGRDTASGLRWLREAATRGDLEAQAALGRLYLGGLEEMGPDPREAESWLEAAAGRGHADAARWLQEARSAKQSEIAYRRWLQLYRTDLYWRWWSTLPYRARWHAGAWVFH